MTETKRACGRRLAGVALLAAALAGCAPRRAAAPASAPGTERSPTRAAGPTLDDDVQFGAISFLDGSERLFRAARYDDEAERAARALEAARARPHPTLADLQETYVTAGDAKRLMRDPTALSRAPLSDLGAAAVRIGVATHLLERAVDRAGQATNDTLRRLVDLGRPRERALLPALTAANLRPLQVVQAALFTYLRDHDADPLPVVRAALGGESEEAAAPP